MADDSHVIDHPVSSSADHRTRYKPTKIEWKSYSGLEFKRPTWLIEDLIPAESLVMLYGARGQGKTFLALSIAASVATGFPCIGKPVLAQGRVAYLLAERPEGLKRRLLGWRKHIKDRTGIEVTMESLDNIAAAGSEQLALDHDRHREMLIASIRGHFREQAKTTQGASPVKSSDKASDSFETTDKFNPKLLIVDPLASHMSGSENSTQDMTAFMNGVRAISRELNCTVLLVHHEGKKNVNNLLGARGSSALEAALDTVLYMRPWRSWRSDDSRYSDGETHHDSENEEGSPDNSDEKAAERAADDGGQSEISELTMTKQREFKELPSVWLRFEEAEDVLENELQPTALGKFPVITDKPQAKSKALSKSRSFKERLRQDILAYITLRHEDKTFRGATVDEVHKHLLTTIRQGDRLGSDSLARNLLNELCAVNLLGRRRDGPYRYFLSGKEMPPD